jgi:hypothetical protein
MMTDGFEQLVISNLESLRDGQVHLEMRMDDLALRLEGRLDHIEAELDNKLDRDDLSVGKLLDTWPKRIAALIALLAAIGVPFLPDLDRFVR